MTTKEFSSYIKGLLDGTALDKTTPEGKIIAALVDICDKMAGEIETLRDELDVANSYIEEIDQDLGSVEEIVYGDDDDCDCCDCDDDDWCDDDDCDCCCCHDCDDDDDDDDFDDDDDEDDEDEDEDEEFYCVRCPSCGGKIFLDADTDPEDLTCPQCQKPLFPNGLGD